MSIIRTETPDLIEQIVNAIPLEFKGDVWVDNGDGTYTINTCDTKWLQPCEGDSFVIDIGGVDYKVTAMVIDSSITVEGPSLPTLTTFDIYAPKFFHGTIIQVTHELNKIDWNKDKLPMIYLNEGISEEVFIDDNQADRESTLNIFFCTDGKFTDWISSDDYEEAKIPMRKLAYAFVDSAIASTLTLRFDSYTVINRDKMAISVSAKGSTEKLFNEDLSGVDMSITIPFSREGCKQCSI